MPKRESGLRTRIAKLLRSRGHLVLVQHGGAYSGSARSDLVVCMRGRFVAIEVKMPGGTYRPGQQEFLRVVNRAGGIAFTGRGYPKTVALLDLVEAHMADPNVLSLEDLMAQLEAAESPSAEPSPDTAVLVPYFEMGEPARVVAAANGDPQAEDDEDGDTYDEVTAENTGIFLPTPQPEVDALTLEFEQERAALAAADAAEVLAAPRRSTVLTADEKLDQLIVLVDDLVSSVRTLLDTLGTSAAPQRAERKVRTPRAPKVPVQSTTQPGAVSLDDTP